MSVKKKPVTTKKPTVASKVDKQPERDPLDPREAANGKTQCSPATLEEKTMIAEMIKRSIAYSDGKREGLTEHVSVLRAALNKYIVASCDAMGCGDMFVGAERELDEAVGKCLKRVRTIVLDTVQKKDYPALLGR